MGNQQRKKKDGSPTKQNGPKNKKKQANKGNNKADQEGKVVILSPR